MHSRYADGFVLMVEGASIDKQAHNMDTERWILDTIVIGTADHECAGVNIIGASRVTDADLAGRAGMGLGAAQLRNGVVGTYEAAGFPRYTMHADGYPVSTNVDRRPCSRG
ncbi:MAG TPA: hypothetical protein VF384_06005 [Planctomycetota bacterium]